MTALTEKVKQEKIIAIIRGLSLNEIMKTAEALEKSGIHFIEVTFNQRGNSADTYYAIKELVREFTHVKIGAGTVITENQVEMAFDAGAEYIISPNVNEKVIRLTKKSGMISIPGAMTPSEITNAYECGADIVKLFPAGQLGVSYIKSISAPLNYIPIAAVGGINLKNIMEFFQAGVCCVGLGANIIRTDYIKEENYGAITELAKSYVQMVRG